MQKTIPADMPVQEDKVQDSSVFFTKFIGKLVALWPWLLVSVVVSLALAFLSLVVNTPAYKIHASILVKDGKNSSSVGEESVLQDLGFLSNKNNVDNEVEILKSRSLMQDVVRRLELNVRYFAPGKLKKTEIYNNKPVKLRFLSYDSAKGPVADAYTVIRKKDGSGYTLKTADEKQYNALFGDSLHIGSSVIALLPGESFDRWQPSQSVIISVGSIDAAARQYGGLLGVAVPNKQVTIINLSLEESLPDRGEQVLNTLIDAYMQANVNDKNRMADSTVKFIDERLGLVFKELSVIEKDIEGFKTSNRLTDISEQSKLLLENTSDFAKQETAQEVQLSVVESLERFIAANENNSRVVPSSLVMQEPSFVALVQRYNDIQLQRDKMLMSQTPDHPSIITVDEQLRNLRKDLMSSIQSIKNGIRASISELKKRTSGFESQISKVPVKERIFLDYSRQQEIKQELYLFLLKKREETAISKSSTIADARVIDTAQADILPFKPNKKFIVIGWFILGLLVPFAIAYVKEFLNNRVSSMQDITNITRTPILAEIGHHDDDENVVAITSKTKSVISEQLRALRTNLEYVLTGEEDKVILITSSMSGEGKSFLSINLSIAIAMAKKKVILLEMDLRKPKITENLGLQVRGFSNFTVSKDQNWQQWVQPSGIQENLDVLCSGPIPPNPSELLMLPKVAVMFEELKKHYDYIVIDSSPAGLVTDAQLLAKYANVSLYMVRHHYTYKRQLQLIEKIYNRKTMCKLNIVVNDIRFKKGYNSYNYNYTYDYYGYAYDQDDNKDKKEKKKRKANQD
ncbi:GumC family protein [Deminuibacter soli]|uniref:non-specific protein-tyrosine kinase n=1 Tax=Deminuibacter soli TaxID=2291815 RepID=A0A3E1NHH4_9BACT|nr:tyrosine-protein kinase [Deminuibacter soli]RFM27403.1 capsular biosynthesis protein [Deminuibacter soli]